MMPVAFTRKTAPVLFPVTKAQLKMQIRHALADGDTTEDDLLDRLIAAASEWVEQYTGRSLLAQTWQLSLPTWAQALWLPRAAPLSSITFVKYYDASNALTTLSSSVYTVPAFQEPAVVLLADTQVWPALYDRADAVQVEYVTGAASAASVPMPLTQSVLLLASYWYANREAGAVAEDVESAVQSLCAPYRVSWREPIAA